jgi:beta-lactamase class D
MYEAFRLSCPPWYQELARRIGKDTMQHWLDSLAYGNKKISRIDTFWLDNSLKIKPDEELGLVKRLYFNQLPFHQRNQEIVKRTMLFENNTDYRLSYKTGWGTKRGRKTGCLDHRVGRRKQTSLFFRFKFRISRSKCRYTNNPYENFKGYFSSIGIFKRDTLICSTKLVC